MKRPVLLALPGAHGAAIPDPVLVMEMTAGKLTWPNTNDVEALGGVPDWAKPLLEAAREG